MPRRRQGVCLRKCPSGEVRQVIDGPAQYYAWLAIVGRAQRRTPADVKASYPKASILKGGRAVFKIKGNDYRLIASVQYQAGA